MSPEYEIHAAHFRAHEGSYAIYREALGFSYVRVREVRIGEGGMGATIEHVPMRGLVDRSGTWRVFGAWEGVFCDEHVFRIPRIGLAAYFAREIVDGVLAALQEDPDGDRHVGEDIMDVISAYWESLEEPEPPPRSEPRSGFKEWSRKFE